MIFFIVLFINEIVLLLMCLIIGNILIWFVCVVVIYCNFIVVGVCKVYWGNLDNVKEVNIWFVVVIIVFWICCMGLFLIV